MYQALLEDCIFLKYKSIFFVCLEAQDLDLNNMTPVKIFERMFQSPENSLSQDDAHPSGQYTLKVLP